MEAKKVHFERLLFALFAALGVNCTKSLLKVIALIHIEFCTMISEN